KSPKKMADDKSECVSFIVLADELIDIILSYRFLDHKDLCHFAQVCVRFREVAYYTEIWKKKAAYRWKHWKMQPNHWKEAFRKRLKTEKEIVNILYSLGAKYGSKADVSNEEYETLTYLTEDDTYAEYLDCTLEEFIYGDPKYINLTYQYYADRLYAFFQKLVLKEEWRNLMEKPTDEQNLEDGALIIAKWVDYTKTDSAMEAMSTLDKMADRVRCIIQEEAPPHQSSSDSRDPQQCMQILEGIKQVMFVEEQFTGNTGDYYNVKNSLITEVLIKKQGIPISLAVVFAAVARRLGVSVEPVNSPHHFLLRWCSNQDPRSNPTSRYTYIDAFHEGKFYTQDECTSKFVSGLASMLPRDTLFPKALPKDSMTILQDMLPIRHDDTIYNLIERVLEQKQREEQEQSKPVKQTLRSDSENTEVKYRIGMVMKHRRYRYGCIIYGWDYSCDMDESWIHQMGVDRLPLGRNQPFYNVLGDDGSSRYAAQ
ncbi:hypothetical protein QZH41_017885, partial [Actinostola sp. cb2023]